MSLDQLTRPEVDTGDDYLLRLDAARDEIWDYTSPECWQKQIVKKPERLAQIRFAGHPDITVLALAFHFGQRAKNLHRDADELLAYWAEGIYVLAERYPKAGKFKHPEISEALAEFIEDLAVKIAVEED